MYISLVYYASCCNVLKNSTHFNIFSHSGIIQKAAQLTVCESICSFCSRMKRGRLYACARREKYNVLAMGQHLDDLAERSAVLLYSVFFVFV